MAENNPPTELPEVSPLSQRIHREYARMEARLPEHASAKVGRIRFQTFEPTLDTEPLDLTRIDVDPAHMQRLKVTEAPKPLERPDRVEDDVRNCTPQFILRNTWRMQMYGDPESLEFNHPSMATEPIGDYLEDARQCRFERGNTTPSLTSDELRVSVALRRVLMVETRWNSIFGRAEPTAEPIDPDPESSD